MEIKRPLDHHYSHYPLLIPRIGKGHHSDSSLDHIMSEADNECVSLLRLETTLKRLQNLPKSLQVTISDG